MLQDSFHRWPPLDELGLASQGILDLSLFVFHSFMCIYSTIVRQGRSFNTMFVFWIKCLGCANTQDQKGGYCSI